MATAKRKRVAERLKTPPFKSEAEEAHWWEANQDLVTDLLIRKGRKSPVKTKSITIRLPEQDIKLAQEMAGKKGMGYQTFIKTVLHGSLKALAERRG